MDLASHLAPEGKHVGLDSAPGRAIIVEPSDAAVDLEGRDVEQPPLEGVDDGLAEGFPTAGGRPVAVVGEGGLEAPGCGASIDLEGLEGLYGGVDLGLGDAARAGLEGPDGVGLSVDGGLLLSQGLP